MATLTSNLAIDEDIVPPQTNYSGIENDFVVSDNTPLTLYGELPEVPLSLSAGDDWHRRADLGKELKGALDFFSGLKVDWSDAVHFFKATKAAAFSVSNTLNEETMEFIEQRHLQEGVTWLQTVVPDFFPCVDFEIELLPAEDGEENMLVLEVHGSLSTLEFREKRYALCEAMIQAGHRNVYEVISIFQQRVRNDGWQIISCYSSLSAE
ncbi:MAG: hypothetical protein V3W31_05415 [Thermodesulfobacteriota bacterium]